MDKQDSKKDDNQKLLLGLLLGAAAGAGAVLVVSSTVNSETKEKIAKKMAPFRDLIQSNRDHLLEYGVTALTSFANKAGAGENSPLQTVVQLLSGLNKNHGEKDKTAKKKGKKKHKHHPKDQS